MLFSITVEEKPERANELSGLMCMAISGGAIVPLLMGELLDLNSERWPSSSPPACFAYLFLLSLKGGGKPAACPLQPRTSGVTPTETVIYEHMINDPIASS